VLAILTMTLLCKQTITESITLLLLALIIVITALLLYFMAEVSLSYFKPPPAWGLAYINFI